MTLILALALGIFLGRFTIPTRELTGWPGIYESLAHIALGVIIGAAIWSEPLHVAALWIVVALSLFELVAFLLTRKGKSP